MIAVVDAAYGNEASAAACVMAAGWESGAAISEFTHRDGPAADYQPGEFYRRELPLIVSVLAMLPRKPDIVADAAQQGPAALQPQRAGVRDLPRGRVPGDDAVPDAQNRQILGLNAIDLYFR